ncbi:MAG: tetratricopeptide repeat protein [Candidatus Glassbacteria bacterium]|nr:tetratricopeptide repeat protein [Candidatus Glassbacteria bacterium]
MSQTRKKTSPARSGKSGTAVAPGAASRFGKLSVAIFLILATAFAAYNKLSRLAQNPSFAANRETCAFWTESAFHYRYAELVARGQGIPAQDTRAQEPEGVVPLENFTIAMEYAVGFSYQLAGSVFGFRLPLHKFTAWFDCLFSCLSITALFFLALVAWKSRVAAMLAAAWYAAAPPSFARSAGGAFLREDFALPFIFGALALLAYSSEKDKTWSRWAAGVIFAIALASWHVAPFLLFLLSLFAAFLFLADSRGSRGFLESFLVLILCCMAAGIAVPVLRAKHFLTGLPMLTSYCVLAAWLVEKKWLAGGRPRLRWLLAVALPLAWAAGAWLARDRTGEFSHVYLLMLDKVRFLGAKPADPAAMSFHSKILWLSAFNSPSAGQVASYFGVGLWVSLGLSILLVRDWLKGRLGIPGRMALVFFFAFAAGYLAVDRLSVFFVFFSALVFGSLALRGGTRMWLLALALGSAVILTDYYRSLGYRIMAYRPDNDLRVVEWLKTNTGPDDTVLAPFQWGPSILAYAGRPVVLHSKFESRGIREKVRDFLGALYGTVEQMEELCRRWRVSYLLVTVNLALDSGPSSYRYVMNRPELADSSAAYAFQYAPETLGGFRLVYQDATTRIFEVGSPWDSLSARVYRENYHPLWDLGLIGTHSDRAVALLTSRLGKPDFHLRLAGHYAEAEPEIAAREYRAALDLGAADARAWYSLSEVLLRLGRSREALSALEKTLAYDPEFDLSGLLDTPAEILSSLGGMLIGKNRWEDAEAFLARALEQQPGNALALNNLGLVRMKQERYEEARGLFERAALCDPGAPAPRRNLGILLLQQDDPGAVEEFRRYLRMAPQAPERVEIMRALRQKGWL